MENFIGAVCDPKEEACERGSEPGQALFHRPLSFRASKVSVACSAAEPLMQRMDRPT